MEHVLRQSLIALRLAEYLGLAEPDRAVAYYLPLLARAGCHVAAYEQANGLATILPAHIRLICAVPAHGAARIDAAPIRRSEQISRRDDQRIRLLYVMTVASTS